MVAMAPLFCEIFSGTYDFELPSTFIIGLHATARDVSYFIADGIYPNWPIFVKPTHATESNAERRFMQRQESVQRDVQRCFGVLQARFCILSNEISTGVWKTS